MKKKILMGFLWGISCNAQEKEPDFFNERTTVVGMEENVVLQRSPFLGGNPYKTPNDKREETGILVDGDKGTSSPPPVAQSLPQHARSAWGGKEGAFNPGAIGWSVPATFMRIPVPQGIAPRPHPTLPLFSGNVWR